MTHEASSAADGGVPLTTLLHEASSTLAAAGVPQPRREARLLAAHALGLTADALLRLPPAATVPAAGARALVARRAAREPLAFITGTAGFWTLDLAVDPSTLIPRADSEALIEAALALRPDRDRVRAILDLGCGTASLLLAALSEYRSAFGIGVDRAEAACRLACANTARTGLADRAAIVCGDWAGMLDARFDLILSNPPYVETGHIDTLMPEVGRHEPRLALDGGADGLDAYRALMPVLDRLLAPGGLAVLEIGAFQEAAASRLAEASGLAIVHRHHDLSGVIRTLALARPDPTPKTVGSRISLG